MERVSIIIQGEGKGHFSQAAELARLLKKNKVELAKVYLGSSVFRRTPAYLRNFDDAELRVFLSPNFLRTPDRKGIRIIFSMLLNVLLSPVYFFEICRIGIMIRRDRNSIMYNFYDPVGALAMKWWNRGTSGVVLSHHFYLSHPDFIHPHGLETSFFYLQLMNRIMMKSVDRVFALSFRKADKFRKIEILPPLLDERVRTASWQPGERDLCYFLNSGFLTDLFAYYRDHPELRADIFCDSSDFSEVPENVQLHVPDRMKFLEAMFCCKRVICTAGFDTVAEAFYLGIPVYLIPSVNHYEQYCNALDAARSGMAFQLEEIADLLDLDFLPAGNKSYRQWVDTFDVNILKKKSGA